MVTGGGVIGKKYWRKGNLIAKTKKKENFKRSTRCDNREKLEAKSDSSKGKVG